MGRSPGPRLMVWMAAAAVPALGSMSADAAIADNAFQQFIQSATASACGALVGGTWRLTIRIAATRALACGF